MRHSITFVTETDNLGMFGKKRMQRMLESLAPQLTEENHRLKQVEYIVSFDPTDISEVEVRRQFATVSFPEGITWRFMGCTGLTYYDLKNEGFKAATGDLVLCIDSDVLPQAGWLRAILTAFERPEVTVLAGHTHIELSSWYNKSFALFWTFPLPETGGLQEAKHFMANNVHFRRPWIAAHLYPQRQAFHDHNRLLLQALHDEGKKLYQHTDARALHDAPRWMAFVKRTFCHGYDNIVEARDAGHHHKATFRGGLCRWHTQLRRSLQRMVANRKLVGLPAIAVPYATGLATIFFTCQLLGEWITLVRPQWIKRYFTLW